jgi:hypothetical protein
MENKCGKTPQALFAATTAEVAKDLYIPNVEKFIEAVRAISK